jgi:hypothetical protein
MLAYTITLVNLDMNCHRSLDIYMCLKDKVWKFETNLPATPTGVQHGDHERVSSTLFQYEHDSLQTQSCEIGTETSIKWST